MRNAVLPFAFEGHDVRVVVHEGEYVFVAMDVCRAVEISKYRDAVALLEEDERVSAIVDTLGGRQAMVAVTQSGLFALIMMSRKPAARRFRKWVTAEVLPALLSTGSYHMRSFDAADAADLEAKRAYYQALPEKSREKADHRAAALLLVDAAIARGTSVAQAVSTVAVAAGMSESSLWHYRRMVYMVPRSDQAAAMAPQYHWPRGRQVPCHPQALALFRDLCSASGNIRASYRRMTAVAEERGWSPIPSERTLRRDEGRLLAPSKARSIPVSTPPATAIAAEGAAWKETP